MKIELLKDHFFHELNHRSQLDSALGLPVAMLATLCGVSGVYAQVFPLPEYGLAGTFQFLFWSGVIAEIFAFTFIVRSFWRFTYTNIADTTDWLEREQQLIRHAEDLKQFHQQMRDWSRDSGEPALAEPSEEFNPIATVEHELRQRYAEAIDQNYTGNSYRTAMIYWAKVSLAAAALFVSVCAWPYFAAKSIEQIPTVRPAKTNNQLTHQDDSMAEKPTRPVEPRLPTKPPPNQDSRDGSPKPKS